MADFCTQCSAATFGDAAEPDINVREIAASLETGTYVNVLCEGCGMKAIGKDSNGNIMVAVPENVKNINGEEYEWIPLEDFEKEHLTKRWYHANDQKESAETSQKVNLINLK